jgi:hypothetical protein
MTSSPVTPPALAARLWAPALLVAGLLLPAGALPAAAETFDACRLLTSDAIEAVQGEAVAHAKASARAGRGLLQAQCFYSLPTAAESVSLQVTLPEPGAETSASPRDQWRGIFHADREERGEEADSDAPVAVPGLGDEAFWVSDRVVGVLYVLEGEAYFRISVGGPEGADVKRERSESLARQVLAKL